MPGRDGTGPVGAGAMTGKGRGICAGAFADGRGTNMRSGCGRRAGRGRMRGFGAGRGYFGAQSQVQPQKELLQQQRDALQKRLDALDGQLKDM